VTNEVFPTATIIHIQLSFALDIRISHCKGTTGTYFVEISWRAQWNGIP